MVYFKFNIEHYETNRVDSRKIRKRERGESTQLFHFFLYQPDSIETKNLLFIDFPTSSFDENRGSIKLSTASQKLLDSLLHMYPLPTFCRNLKDFHVVCFFASLFLFSSLSSPTNTHWRDDAEAVKARVSEMEIVCSPFTRIWFPPHVKCLRRVLVFQAFTPKSIWWGKGT